MVRNKEGVRKGKGKEGKRKDTRKLLSTPNQGNTEKTDVGHFN